MQFSIEVFFDVYKLIPHKSLREVYENFNSAFLNSFVIMDMVVRLDDGSITNIEIQKVP